MLNTARHGEGEPSSKVNPCLRSAALIADLRIWRYAVWYTCARCLARADELSDDFPVI